MTNEYVAARCITDASLARLRTSVEEEPTESASDSRDGVELAAALVFCFGIGPIGAYCQWQLGGY